MFFIIGGGTCVRTATVRMFSDAIVLFPKMGGAHQNDPETGSRMQPIIQFPIVRNDSSACIALEFEGNGTTREDT
jgi:hypothetical protein